MIRLGTIEDLAAIGVFDLFGGSREQEVADGRLRVFEDTQGRPIGYISIADYRFHDFPYLTFILVHPDHRRSGIATKLLHDSETIHIGQRMFISTESDNDAMLALLKKERYRYSGTLCGLNDSHNGTDEVFFFKDL